MFCLRSRSRPQIIGATSIGIGSRFLCFTFGGFFQFSQKFFSQFAIAFGRYAQHFQAHISAAAAHHHTRLLLLPASVFSSHSSCFSVSSLSGVPGAAKQIPGSFRFARPQCVSGSRQYAGPQFLIAKAAGVVCQ